MSAQSRELVVSGVRPGGVLALDLAGVVGYAYGHTHDRWPSFGRWILPHDGGEGKRYAAFENELAEAMELYQPSKMIIEKSFSLQAFAQSSNYRVMTQQITLRGIAYSEAYRCESCGIPSEIDCFTVRSEVMGVNHFAKDAVKREVIRWCWGRQLKVPDHNSADAVLTWVWYKRRVTGAAPISGPLFRGEL